MTPRSAAGLPPDRRQMHRAPAALALRGPQDSSAGEAVEEPVAPPEEMLEPHRWQLRRLSRLGAHSTLPSPSPFTIIMNLRPRRGRAERPIGSSTVSAVSAVVIVRYMPDDANRVESRSSCKEHRCLITSGFQGCMVIPAVSGGGVVKGSGEGWLVLPRSTDCHVRLGHGCPG